MRVGWRRESARHSLAARGVRTKQSKHGVAERYAAAEAIEDEEARLKELFATLHEVTVLQDYIQLSIPPYNDSVRHTLQLTNDANAMMLALSRSNGNMESVLNDQYFHEKFKLMVVHYNNMVHDYNLSVDDKSKLRNKAVMTFEPERANVVEDGEDIKRWKEYLWRKPG